MHLIKDRKKTINNSIYRVILFFLLVSFYSFSPAQIWGQNQALAKRAEEALADHLPLLRTDSKSLRLTQGNPPLFTFPLVESLFNSPLAIFSQSNSLLAGVEQAPALSSVYASLMEPFAGKRPVLSSLPPADIPVPAFPSGFPSEFRPALSHLYQNLSSAKLALDRSIAALPDDTQKKYFQLLTAPTLSRRDWKITFASLERFDQAALLEAGDWFVRGIDLVQEELPQPLLISQSYRWETPLGVFWLRGSDDDTTENGDLKNVCVLIDAGGRNAYAGPMAAAQSGEIRLVLDYGSDITIYSSESGAANAGSGLFGLGALILPNGDGLKRIVSPSFSQGCGIGGVGILDSAGPVQLDGRRYVQGVGSFGIGLLRIRNGRRSTYTAQRSAQGLGLTMGIGAFLHEGDGADIKGGLVEPDPREPLGTVSLCQGVGYGPRGYAGGGIGLASIKGSSVTVLGSYFAQGCGYWHGLGIFHLAGNDSTVQARRYDQGSGVHYAFGHFSIEGNRNTILNWGVGPSYGWDRGLGSSLIAGDSNRFQTEWGAGQGSIGGLSLTYLEGKSNILSLAQFGYGSFFRDEMGRSLQIVQGEKNRFRYGVSSSSGSLFLTPNPWGLVHLIGGQTDADLKVNPINWNGLPRLEPESPDLDLPELFEHAKSPSAPDRLENLVDLAAAFSLDKTTPRQALQLLLQSSTDDLTTLVDLVDPAAVDQLIQLRILLSAFGPDTAETIIQTSPAKPGAIKPILMNFLDAGSASRVVPVLLKILDQEKDPKIKSRAMIIMSRFFSQDSGNEPGQRALLRSLVNYLKSGKKQIPTAEANSLLSRMFVSDAFGLVAKTLGFTADSRVEFLKKMPADLSDTIGPKGALAIFDRIDLDPQKSLSALEQETNILEGLETQVRTNVLSHLNEGPDVSVAAVMALGQIGSALDAPRIRPLLTSNDSRVREAATVALGRMDQAGVHELERAYKKGSPSVRKLVLAALPHATSVQAASLIEKGLSDSEPMVRMAAVAALTNLSPAMEKVRDNLKKAARHQLDKEKDPSVRLALQSALL